MRRLKNAFLVPAVLAMVAFVAPAQAKSLMPIDGKILSTLHHGNQLEIQMAQLALEKSQSKSVKSLATMLLQDHTEADKQLMELATQRGIAIEALTGATKEEAQQLRLEQENLQRLQAATGRDFDVLFLDINIAKHEQTIARLTEALPLLSDASVRQFIEALLPKLQAHREHALLARQQLP